MSKSHQRAVHAKSCLSHDRRGKLSIEEHQAKALSDRYGTPLFVVCENHLRQSFRHFRHAFARRYDKVEIAYSYKTNFLPTVCHILHQEGAWAEVVSLLELGIAKRLKVDPSKIIFNGPGKSDGEIIEAARLEIRSINVDSIGELRRVHKISEATRAPINIGFRLNIGDDLGFRQSKFGLDITNSKTWSTIRTVMKKDRLRLSAIHCHAGTQIVSPRRYRLIVGRLLSFRDMIQRKLGISVELIDLGGGFPERNLPPIGSTMKPIPSIDDFASEICHQIHAANRQTRSNAPTLVLEPGRAIVASPFFLLTRITAVKSSAGTGQWVITDAGLNLLPEAEYFRHRILPAVSRRGRHADINVGGPLCMYEDCLAFNVRLPPLREGDILVICDAGAYSISLSWQFMRPRPPVCLLREKSIEMIRRPEKEEDVLKLDVFPPPLRY